VTETLAAADLARYQASLTIQQVLHRASTIAIVLAEWSTRWIVSGS